MFVLFSSSSYHPHSFLPKTADWCTYRGRQDTQQKIARSSYYSLTYPYILKSSCNSSRFIPSNRSEHHPFSLRGFSFPLLTPVCFGTFIIDWIERRETRSSLKLSSFYIGIPISSRICSPRKLVIISNIFSNIFMWRSVSYFHVPKHHFEKTIKNKQWIHIPSFHVSIKVYFFEQLVAILKFSIIVFLSQ
jgi:hypothetical protein